MASTQMSRAAGTRVPFVSTLTRDLDEMQNRLRRAFNLPAFEPLIPSFVQPVGWNPAVEVAETPEQFTVTAELPGLTAKDVSVDFEDGVLTLKGEKAESKTEQDQKYYVWERSYGAFERSFTFPTAVEQDKIKASFENGVLTVGIPKTRSAKANGRKINITEK
ncbi:MAG: Hsp20/alpha crystallin family protein [Gemmatimonadota bacterium]|nr:Hsp20/alpha crystallin family protein [Gemmatimonadota bacterium]HEU4988154.1 Hsp20/alpha crystallin family protein [Gemmatimonadaceae bacterium]